MVVDSEEVKALRAKLGKLVAESQDELPWTLELQLVSQVWSLAPHSALNLVNVVAPMDQALQGERKFHLRLAHH